MEEALGTESLRHFTKLVNKLNKARKRGLLTKSEGEVIKPSLKKKYKELLNEIRP